MAIDPNDVDGEETGENMELGYDDANGATDGLGNTITSDDDVIEGNGGDDTIFGEAGNDTIDGGAGNDTIYGDSMGSDGLLANGSFEDTTLGTANGSPAFGWVKTGDGSGVWPMTTSRIEDGSRAYALGGASNNAGQTLSQTVTTVPGEPYILNFSSGLFTATTGTLRVNVYDSAGNVISTQDIALSPGSSTTGLENFSVTFDAVDDASTIEFENVDVVNGDIDIDKVWLSGPIAEAYDDTISGGDGNDTIHGQRGDDTIMGDIGDDILFGDIGDDTIDGGDGADTIEGGTGSDNITGGIGDDLIHGDVVLEVGETAYTVAGYIGRPFNPETFDASSYQNEFGGTDYTVLNSSLGATPNALEMTINSQPQSIVFIDGDSQLTNDTVGEVVASDPDQYVLIDGVRYNVVVDYQLQFTDLETGNTYEFAVLDVDWDQDGDFNNDVAGTEGEDGAIMIPLGDVPPVGATLKSTVITDGSSNLNYADLLDATLANDTIDGGDGNDTIYGGVGDDALSGGTGDDTIDGGFGVDTIDGGTGLDVIDGGEGNDIISGGDEADTIHGQRGDDTIRGDAGDDILFGDTGDDNVLGGDGADIITGGVGSDTIDGGAGDDVIYGDVQLAPGETAFTVSGYYGTPYTDTAPNIDPAFKEQFAGSDFTTVQGSLGQDPSVVNTQLVFNTQPQTIVFVDGDSELTNDSISETVISDPDQYVLIDGVRYNAALDYQLQMVDPATGITYDFAVVDVDWEGDGDFTLDTNGSEGEDGPILIPLGTPPPTGVTLDTVAITDDTSNLNFADIADNTLANDTINGGDGNDTIYGGDGDDAISGDAGDDIISGDGGVDTIFGGAGNDTITAGGGDTVAGDDDRDYFTIEGGYIADGNVINIDGGTGSTAAGDVDDYDVLDFNASGLDVISINRTADADGNSVSGSAVVTDGVDTYTVNFVEIEKIICFARGTHIKTNHGETPVEKLKVGDMVLTQDKGFQPIRWIKSRVISAAGLEANPKLYPIRISKGALGKGLPEKNLVVSPQHRVLARSRVAKRMFNTDEVLISAKSLLGMSGIDVITHIDEVEYFHFMFDEHEIVYANGAPSESLFTGPEALKAVDQKARAEIIELFPELKDEQFVETPARFIPQGKRLKKMIRRHIENQIDLQ